MKELIVLALTLAAGPLWAKPQKFELKEGLFRCEIPSWTKNRDEARDGRQKIYGVLLTAPTQGDGPRSSLSVEYYAPGNSYFKDAAEYLNHQSAPSEFALKGKTISKPAPIQIGGLKGKRWFKQAPMPFPPNSLRAETFRMKTEFVLLQAAQGFYVLSYTAPQDKFQKNHKAFQRTLDTFEAIK